MTLSRYIITFCVMIVGWGSSASGQEVNNYHFTIDDSHAKWQKVYETTYTFEQLAAIIEQSGRFEALSFFENKITGTAKPIYLDYEALGYARMTTQFVVLSYKAYGFTTIEYKDGRYRVSIKDIELSCQSDNGTSEKGDIESFDELTIKKGVFRKSFYKGAIDVYDYSFDHYFDFKPLENDDDW